MNKFIILLLVLTANIYSKDWKTIESNNFKVHYEEKSEYIAQETIKYLINIDSWLTKYLKHKPKMTNVVISDSIDDANGFARVVPYNLIHIYPYPPEAESVLGYYDNWLYILVLHEYLHIVHIDTKGVIPEIINSIFGKIMAPNQVLPKFITEGLAVYFESLTTQRGRLNSPLYKMMFRTSVLNNQISLSELSNYTAKYPYGGIVYLYGSFFMQWLFKYNPSFEEIAKFTENYGKNIIPYGINRALKHASGKTFDNEYIKFIEFYKKKYKKLYKKIKKNKITKYKRILKDNKFYIPICNNVKKHKGKSVADFAVSSDGSLYILSGGAENLSYLYKYNSKDKKVKKIMKFNDSASNIEILDNRLYYISLKLHKNRTERRLSSINLDGTYPKIELENLRVVNFAFNKNNYDVALVVNNHGIENIYMYNLKNKTLNKLTSFKTLTTIGVPYFIKNNKLLLSMNHNNELWNLYILDVANRHENLALHKKCKDKLSCLPISKLKKITNKNFNIAPIYIKDKIYFISDLEDEILNLYSLNLKDNKINKKTNFFTGIKKALYNHKTKEFYALRFQKDNAYEVISIKEEDLINKELKENNKEDELLFLKSYKDIDYKTKEFSVFPEIFPQNIMPQITASNFENSIGLEITGNDVRQYYSYSLFATYQFDISDFLFALYLSDTSNYLSYSFGYSYTPFISDSLIINNVKTNFHAQYHTFSATVSLPFYNADGINQIYFSASNRYLDLPKFKYEYKPYDSLPILPKESDKFRFSLGYYYSSTDRSLLIPGTAEGNSLNIRLSFRDKELLATYNTLTFAISYKNFFPIDFFQEHLHFHITYL